MQKMKNSGLEFVGDIPAHWIMHPVYYYFGERKHRNSFGLETNLLSLSYGKVVRKDINTTDGLLPTSFNTYNIIETDDIIIRPTDLQNDKRSLRTGLATEHGIITSAYIALMPIRPLNSGYFYYLLHAFDISKVFYNMGNGVRQGLNYSEFSRLMVMEPPREEQDAIVAFLDTKCAEIDALAADIQAQINTLEQYKRSVITEAVTRGLNPNAEMRDSEIQWIGIMPTHWECIRGKYILQYVQRPIREDDSVITCFRDGEVTLRSNRREDGFTMADKEIGYQGIDVGDLVVHGMDGFAGAIGISDSRGKASPVLTVLETTQDKRYIMYFLRSMAYSDLFWALATGIRVRSCDLRWNKLSELFYPIPPLGEQEAIVAHIDDMIQKTNAAIAGKKALLETLEEYKRSLIFEYVTGKKEVPKTVAVVGIDPHVPLLAMIVDMLKRPRGKVFDQKLLYLCDSYLGLGLNTQYYRYDYGPLDLQLDSYIDTLVSKGWYKIDNMDRARILVRAENHAEVLNMYEEQFSHHESSIRRIVKYFEEKRVGEIERFATLFAVWNDFIIDGIPTPSDDQIINEVLTNWEPTKALFSQNTWQDTLAKMKRDEIIPKGLGLHTLPKPKGGTTDAQYPVREKLSGVPAGTTGARQRFCHPQSCQFRSHVCR